MWDQNQTAVKRGMNDKREEELTSIRPTGAVHKIPNLPRRCYHHPFSLKGGDVPKLLSGVKAGEHSATPFLKKVFQ